MSARRRQHPYVYIVRFQRRGWKEAQARHYFTRHAARTKVKKLLGGERPDLAPLTLLTVERRRMGPVEVVYTLEDHR